MSTNGTRGVELERLGRGSASTFFDPKAGLRAENG